MRLRNVWRVGVLVLLLAACSSQPKFNARTAMPCDMYTSADATELLGQSVQQASMGSVPDLQQADYISCAYLTKQVPPSGVSFTVFGRQNASNGETFYKTTQTESQSQNTYTPVKDIGDEAFWNGSSLLVRQGTQVIGVTAAKSGQNDLNLARAVAIQVLARMR